MGRYYSVGKYCEIVITIMSSDIAWLEHRDLFSHRFTNHETLCCAARLQLPLSVLETRELVSLKRVLRVISRQQLQPGVDFRCWRRVGQGCSYERTQDRR